MLIFLRLNCLDEAPPPSFKPLLSAESLRRLAWSVYFMDATVSGGVFGQNAIVTGCYTIQLPSEERPFLQHIHTTTEPLVPPSIPHNELDPPLGLGAHLIRAITARQILAGLHTQLQRRYIPVHDVARAVDKAERRALAMLDSLPLRMAYSRSQYHVYKDQMPLLLALHVMRNTAQRHLSLLRVAAAKQIGGPGEADIPIYRAQMIADAKLLSTIFKDAAELDVALDPQLAMHAYNGFESEPDPVSLCRADADDSPALSTGPVDRQSRRSGYFPSGDRGAPAPFRQRYPAPSTGISSRLVDCKSWSDPADVSMFLGLMISTPRPSTG